MSVNKLLRDALLPFGDPVEFGEFVNLPGENAERYFQFGWTTVNEDFADNAPGHQRFLITVEFYCPRSYDCIERNKQVQQALFAAGFTWPSITTDADKTGQHIIFECEIAEGVKLHG
jgi:hypothetical protein